MGTSIFTSEQLDQLPALYATESVQMEQKQAVVLLYLPGTNWFWYVIEFDGEDMCFGFVIGHDMEFGYFSLKELQSVTGPLGESVQRDFSFTPQTIGDILR